MSATRLLLPLSSHSTACKFEVHRQRFQPVLVNPTRSLESSSRLSLNFDEVFGCGSVSSLINQRIVQNKRNLVVYCSLQPAGAPTPGNPSGTNWKGWIVGMLLTMILPFYRTKLNPFLALKKEVETVVDTAELVLDIVEKVAEEVEEIADSLGDKLPEGGKLKNAFDRVENVAREIGKDANAIEDLLQKVEKAEKEIGRLIEPVIHEQVNKINEVAGESTGLESLKEEPKSKL